MATVPFATLCDRCGRRSEEYTSWPSCRDCLDDICPDCDVASERTEDEAHSTQCRGCAAEEAHGQVHGIR
jgi:NMD protein affecting ribosome stability and mRNA decay